MRTEIPCQHLSVIHTVQYTAKGCENLWTCEECCEVFVPYQQVTDLQRQLEESDSRFNESLKHGQLWETACHKAEAQLSALRGEVEQVKECYRRCDVDSDSETCARKSGLSITRCNCDCHKVLDLAAQLADAQIKNGDLAAQFLSEHDAHNELRVTFNEALRSERGKVLEEAAVYLEATARFSSNPDEKRICRERAVALRNLAQQPAEGVK